MKIVLTLFWGSQGPAIYSEKSSGVSGDIEASSEPGMGVVFNSYRLMEAIGRFPLAEAEINYYQQVLG